jgi:hypothetical protein
MSSEGEDWLRDIEAEISTQYQGLAMLTPKWPAPRDPILEIATLRVLVEDARAALVTAKDLLQERHLLRLTEHEVAIGDMESLLARIGTFVQEGT